MKLQPQSPVPSMDLPLRTCRRNRLITLLLGGAFLWVTPSFAQPNEASNHGQGKLVYEQYCAVCHGKDGRADTPVSRLLTPKPRNYTDPVEIGRVTVDRMYLAIKKGIPGTAMSAWDQVLSEIEIGDVIDYVRSFALAGGVAPLSAEKLSFEVGRRIYASNCAVCHGENGKADTETAKVIKPTPTDFSDPFKMARIDDGRLYLAIHRGKPGTSMGGWGGVLTPAEMIDLMRYTRRLAGPLPAGMRPGELDFLIGKDVYTSYCLGCHGEQGDGLTALGLQLSPHPPDFTSPAEMASKDDRQLARSIMRGINGTAMASWGGVLNKEDVRRVIVFIRRSFSSSRSETPQKSR